MNEVISNISNWIEVILAIVAGVVAVVAIVYRVKSNFTQQISNFISLAASRTDLSGPERMQLVISWLKDIVPRIFRVIFDDKTLTQISQNIYDDMKTFAQKYNKPEDTTKEETELD